VSVDVFVTFDGQCRDAVAFYATVFDSAPTSMMTFAENPQADVAAADRDRILYAALPLGTNVLMFSDCPSGSGHIPGNNIALTFGSPDPRTVEQVFDRLSDGGQVLMPLGRTFFSEQFGMVRDQFGIMWQIAYAPEPPSGV